VLTNLLDSLLQNILLSPFHSTLIFLKINKEIKVNKYSNGRITLVGNAAHTIAPTVHMADTLAIEDAAVLADCLASNKYPFHLSIRLIRSSISFIISLIISFFLIHSSHLSSFISLFQAFPLPISFFFLFVCLFVCLFLFFNLF
jgi:hypothetical protein